MSKKDEMEVLQEGIASLKKTLELNEKSHTKIIEKQLIIHRQQLKISIIFAVIFTLFFIISGIYVKHIITEYLNVEELKRKESDRKESVIFTSTVIREMIDWSDKTEKEDSIYKYFLHNDYRRALEFVKKQPKNEQIHPDQIISNNYNIDKFYSFFEILKNYNHTRLLNREIAFDMLYPYKNAGKDFKIIDKIRNSEHKISNCDCGLIYDGYEKIYEDIFEEKLNIHAPNDIPDNKKE